MEEVLSLAGKIALVVLTVILGYLVQLVIKRSKAIDDAIEAHTKGLAELRTDLAVITRRMDTTDQVVKEAKDNVDGLREVLHELRKDIAVLNASLAGFADLKNYVQILAREKHSGN